MTNTLIDRARGHQGPWGDGTQVPLLKAPSPWSQATSPHDMDTPDSSPREAPWTPPLRSSAGFLLL